MTFDNDPFSDDALPPAFLRDLRASQRTPIVPPAVDASIRSTARSYFAGQRRIRLWVRIGGGLAAAVALTVGLRLAFPPAMEPNLPVAANTTAQLAAAGSQDIDNNGVVDILDAFTVARGVKGDATQPTWDINGDGVVDRKDADAIAATAVRVKGAVR